MCTIHEASMSAEVFQALENSTARECELAYLSGRGLEVNRARMVKFVDNDGDEKVVMITIDCGAPAEFTLLSEAPSDPEAYLESAIMNWVQLIEDSEIRALASYEWGLSSPEDDVVSDDYRGQVRVLRTQCVGDRPHSTGISFAFLECDDGCAEFASKAAADAAVAEAEAMVCDGEGIEFSRPEYYVVAA